MNREESAAAEKNYGMTMERRGRAAITGVTDVESFDETAVILHTHGGRLILTGSGLHVASLQLEEGRLTVEGSIDSAAYDGPGVKRRGGFLRRALG